MSLLCKKSTLWAIFGGNSATFISSSGHPAGDPQEVLMQVSKGNVDRQASTTSATAATTATTTQQVQQH